jgi:hypothetical protein
MVIGKNTVFSMRRNIDEQRSSYVLGEEALSGLTILNKMGSGSDFKDIGQHCHIRTVKDQG